MFVNYKRKKSKKNNICAIDNIYSLCYNVTVIFLGCSQVGKAPDFDSGIRRFESCHPSQRGAVPPKKRRGGVIFMFYRAADAARSVLIFRVPGQFACVSQSRGYIFIYGFSHM